MKFYKRFYCINFSVFLIIFLLLFCFSSFSLANTETTYVWSNQSEKLKTVQTNVNILSSSDSTITDNSLGLESPAACLIEQSSGLVIYDHNMHEQLRPASVTKVMSLLLIMEALDSGKINLTDSVPCTEDAANMGGSQIWLDVRETLTVEEMIKAICIVSANDCVVAMANYLEGSQEAFVKKMNDKAKSLGMNDTVFKNCHGIDEDGHLTSCYDIAIMSRELLINHPNITNYTTIYMDSLRDGKSSLVNTNKLVRNYTGCTGLKTGSTSLALFNLSASATRDNLSLIAVIMKSPTSKIRFSEAQKLLDYGFSNYQVTSFGSKGDVIKNLKVNKGKTEYIDAILENDAQILTKKSSNDEITQEIILDESISAPILKGQKLGEINFNINGSTVSSINLISDKQIDSLGFGNIAKLVLNQWFSLFRK